MTQGAHDICYLSKSYRHGNDFAVPKNTNGTYELINASKVIASSVTLDLSFTATYLHCLDLDLQNHLSTISFICLFCH